MEKTDIHPRKRKRRGSFLPLLLTLCGVSGAAVIAFQYFQQRTGEELLVPRDNTPIAGLVSPDFPAEDDRQQQFSIAATAQNSGDGTDLHDGDAFTNKDLDSVSGSQPGLQPESTLPGAADRQAQATTGRIPAEIAGQNPERARTAIDSFYSYLDQQSYIKNFNFNAPSKTYFSQLIQKLLDTPPVVSGETRDLFTILQNTAHFFRVAGREDIIALKAIISHEKDSYEDILADFYTLSKRPAYLRESFSINLHEDALYDYAGFFLTTMGGRLYLFRRDSSLRMLVSYYSILIVDEAVQSGRNRHGIDLRPAIANLIGEIENNGSLLKHKELYLDNLYDLKEKYL